MQDKRFQVFISSTFEDLKGERRAVQDVVITTVDFPVQMESFPAADEDQTQFIYSLIDKCDYYVLIIAGRYGTVAEDGISYTHQEFRYAVQIGVPVLVLLHGNLGQIPVERTETTEAGRERLKAFINEACTRRLRKTWTTLDELKLCVREALDHAKATKPRAGWVRGDMVATVEALEELNEVRRENARLRAQLDRSSVELNFPEIPTIDSSIDIGLFQNNRSLTGTALSTAKIRTTWAQAFPLVKRSLIWEMGYEGFSIEVEGSCIQVGSALAQEVSKCDIGTCFRISRGDLDRLTAYYIEAGLMAEEGHEGPFTDLAAKFARRLLLVESEEASFELVSGSVEIVQTSSSVDDEIPF